MDRDANRVRKPIITTCTECSFIRLIYTPIDALCGGGDLTSTNSHESFHA